MQRRQRDQQQQQQQQQRRRQQQQQRRQQGQHHHHQPRPRPIVHLQHGLLGASSDWVLNGPELSLAFLLADAGFDVWLGNVRANSYSRNHTSLSRTDAAFWAFTWDNIASRDLPAMFEKELATTGAETLAYVGHSQGTTVAMALLSMQPQWAERVRVAALLAPVAFATNLQSAPLVALAKLNTDQIFTLLGVWEFLPSSEILSRLDGRLCHYEPHLCVSVLAMICGYNPDNVDLVRLPTYLNHTPSGTSVQNMAHWCQAIRSPDPGLMQFFDFGTRCTTVYGGMRDCNQRRYGALSPPRYDLSAITTPLALFTGGQDRLADPADAALLLARLPPGVVVSRRHDADYEHLDYIWGVTARERVYSEVIELLRNYSGGGGSHHGDVTETQAAAARNGAPARGGNGRRRRSSPRSGGAAAADGPRQRWGEAAQGALLWWRRRRGPAWRSLFPS